jgi:hypothetical protein
MAQCISTQGGKRLVIISPSHCFSKTVETPSQTNILKEMVAGEQTAKEESQARITTPVAHFLHVGLKLQARKCVILMSELGVLFKTYKKCLRFAPAIRSKPYNKYSRPARLC